jgi:pilus assembly protein CpaF
VSEPFIPESFAEYVPARDGADPVVRRVVDTVGRRLSDEIERLEAGRTVRVTHDDERMIASTIAYEELATIAEARLRAGEPGLTQTDEAEVVDMVLAEMFGLGGLQRYLDDPEVENIDVNGVDRVFVTYADGRTTRVSSVAPSEDALLATIKNAARRLGLGERRWDTAEPILDLQLADGSRLHAVLGGRTERGMAPHPAVSIRRHRFSDLDLDDLYDLGAVDDQLVAFLRAAVLARRTILVAGGTNTGKTTLLRALCHEIPADERLITVEKDLLELGLHRSARHPNVVSLYSRQANVEGHGEVSVAELVRSTLRMNPSRVIVGEVLGDEVVPMLNAMSQGNDGSMCTIHSDSSEGVFYRLASYAVQASRPLPAQATFQLVAGAVHFVVYLSGDRHPGRPMRRYVSSVREVAGLNDTGHVMSSEIFDRGPNGLAVPAAPLTERSRDLLEPFGYDATEHLGGGRW